MTSVYFCIIGLAAGWLAAKLTKGSSLGLIRDLFVGFVGSIGAAALLSVLRATNQA